MQKWGFRQSVISGSCGDPARVVKQHSGKRRRIATAACCNNPSFLIQDVQMRYQSTSRSRMNLFMHEDAERV